MKEQLDVFSQSATSLAYFFNKQFGSNLLSRKLFISEKIDGTDFVPKDGDSISPSLMGVASESLARLMLGADFDDVIDTAWGGACMYDDMFSTSEPGAGFLSIYLDTASRFVDSFLKHGILFVEKPNVVRDFVKLCSLEIYARSRRTEGFPEPFDFIISDADVVHVVAIAKQTVSMVSSLDEDIIEIGFSYTLKDLLETSVSGADGDLLMSESVIDIKCYSLKSNAVSPKNRYQLLVYYLLLMLANRAEGIEYLRIFSVRSGVVHTVRVSDIPLDTAVKLCHFGRIGLSEDVLAEVFKSSD